MLMQLRPVLTMSVLSTRNVRVQVSDVVDGVALVDPTGDEVSFAFMAPGVNPSPTDLVTGSWQTIGTNFYALCLVGPGGHVLTTGTYLIWIKVGDSPEIPVEIVGVLRVE
jgi:hypothetical protein